MTRHALKALPQSAALAAALMLLLRALHPPGGAVALLTVLAASQMAPLGWHLLIPMAVLSGVLAAVGVLYHRACGRPYLHQPPQAAKTQRPTTRLALSEQDLEQLLQRFENIVASLYACHLVAFTNQRVHAHTGNKLRASRFSLLHQPRIEAVAQHGV